MAYRKFFLWDASAYIYASIILLLGCSSVAVAKGPSPWLPDSFSAKFTQIYLSAVSGKEQRGQGQLDYAYPGKIKFAADKPDPFIFTSNGQKTWYYYPPFIEGESGELSVQEQGNLWLNQFFDLLRYGPQTNDRYTATAQGLQWLLKFSSSTAKEVQAQQAQLKFKTKAKQFKELQEIVLLKANGQKVTFILEAMNLAPNLAAGYFDFTPPPKTKIKEI